jgi:hypothetical protein
MFSWNGLCESSAVAGFIANTGLTQTGFNRCWTNSVLIGTCSCSYLGSCLDQFLLLRVLARKIVYLTGFVKLILTAWNGFWFLLVWRSFFAIT